MRINFIFGLIGSLFLISFYANAQNTESKTKTEEILQSLNKTKSASSVKRGVTKEKFKEIRNEAVIKKNLSEYSGVYESSGINSALEIKITNDGKIEAKGFEPADANSQDIKRFVLENAKIEGALLTATKVYEDKTTGKFEGVFVNRTVREGTSPNNITYTDTAFGLAVVGINIEIDGGLTIDRLFYKFKQ